MRKNLLIAALFAVGFSTSAMAAGEQLDGYSGNTNNVPPVDRGSEVLFYGDLTPELGLGCSNPSGTSGGPNDVALGVTASLTPPLAITSHYYNIFTNVSPNISHRFNCRTAPTTCVESLRCCPPFLSNFAS